MFLSFLRELEHPVLALAWFLGGRVPRLYALLLPHPAQQGFHVSPAAHARSFIFAGLRVQLVYGGVVLPRIANETQQVRRGAVTDAVILDVRASHAARHGVCAHHRMAHHIKMTGCGVPGQRPAQRTRRQANPIPSGDPGVARADVVDGEADAADAKATEGADDDIVDVEFEEMDDDKKPS